MSEEAFADALTDNDVSTIPDQGWSRGSGL
jgi:hypothetical protein